MSYSLLSFTKRPSCCVDFEPESAVLFCTQFLRQHHILVMHEIFISKLRLALIETNGSQSGHRLAQTASAAPQGIPPAASARMGVGAPAQSGFRSDQPAHSAGAIFSWRRTPQTCLRSKTVGRAKLTGPPRRDSCSRNFWPRFPVTRATKKTG